VTPIKIENHEDSVLTPFFQDVTFLDQAQFNESQAKRADRCEPATLINHCSGDFLSYLSPPMKSKIIKIPLLADPVAILVLRFANCHQKVLKSAKKSRAETAYNS
jgi:hypothetical protein